MTDTSLIQKLPSLAAWLGITFIAAAVGAAASINAGAFYTQLNLPAWAPPPSVFGPVWTVLYLMIGISAWIIWTADKSRLTQTALSLFIGQLALNSLWSWLFFSWHRGALAFADIMTLLILIVATMFTFYRIRPIAAWLLAPYVLWVSFASVLNYTLWQLNPQSLG